MVYYLDLEDALTVARDACGGPVEVADFGMLASALGRPATTVFGQDAYPELFDKAAALMHSLARNHALVDGNKRLAWGAAWAFLEVNGQPLASKIDVDLAEDFVLDVAQGKLEVPEISTRLRSFAD